MKALKAELETELEKKDQARRAGLVKARAGLSPDPNLGKCPVTIDLPIPGRAPQKFNIERMKRQTRALARVGLDFVKPDALSTSPSPLVEATRSRLRIGPYTRLADFEKNVAEVRADAWWDHDLVVVEEERADAERGEEGSFSGGYFIGTAYLWSYAEEKVICAARIRHQLTKVASKKTYLNGEEIGDSFGAASKSQLSFAVLDRALQDLVRVAE